MFLDHVAGNIDADLLLLVVCPVLTIAQLLAHETVIKLYITEILNFN